MRGLLLGVVALSAACEEGVVLEVHVPPGSQATSVRLFVGFEACYDARGNACPGLAPPASATNALREVLPGVVYHREPIDDELVRTAKVEGGVARFRIESASGISKLPFAVAVDDLNESAQYIPELSLDGAKKYRIDLAPAMKGALGNRPATPTINVVEIWNQPTRMLPCMGFERWQNGSLAADRVFIVPADDPDCDEIMTNECAPYAYKGTQPPPIEQTSCVQAFFAGDLGTCRLGGVGCSDLASNPTSQCAASEYCVPTLYCERGTNPACSDPFGFANTVKCLFQSPPPINAKLSCTIGLKPSPDGTHADLCQSTIPIDAAAMNLPDGIDCVTPSSPALLLTEPSMVGTPMLAFTEKVTFATRNQTTELPLELELRHEFDCKYKIELNGEVAASPFIDQAGVFAQFAITRNGGPVRKLLVPLDLQFSDCAQVKCELKIDALDSLGKCLR